MPMDWEIMLLLGKGEYYQHASCELQEHMHTYLNALRLCSKKAAPYKLSNYLIIIYYYACMCLHLPTNKRIWAIQYKIYTISIIM